MICPPGLGEAFGGWLHGLSNWYSLTVVSFLVSFSLCFSLCFSGGRLHGDEMREASHTISCTVLWLEETGFCFCFIIFSPGVRLLSCYCLVCCLA